MTVTPVWGFLMNAARMRSGLGSCGVVLPKKLSSSIAVRPVCASLPLTRPNL